MKQIGVLLTAFLISGSAFAQKVTLKRDDAAKKVDVLVDGKPFTSYFYPGQDVLKKAVLYPVRTAEGTVITRGWPFDPRPGERVDHPHHVGIWLNYEDVNKNDYWNNSTNPPSKTAKYGTIVHTGISKIKGNQLEVTADWIDNSGKLTLKETTVYTFSAKGDERIIDRATTLKAVNGDVEMPDVKDGMYAIRLARQLELPSNKPEIFTDAAGVATKVPVLNNDGITGNYRNKEGITGEDVWGKRSVWCNLTGKIGNENISVAIIDYPKNPGYPTYWHARGYGLFAANPIGQKALSNGKEVMNFKIANGASSTFKYRLVVASHHLSDGELNTLADGFAKTK